MDKRKVLDIIFQSSKYTNEQKEIIRSIMEAKEEWDIASRYFQAVNEPALIDYAIHREDAAKSKYMHYLTRAKEEGITMDLCYMIQEA